MVKLTNLNLENLVVTSGAQTPPDLRLVPTLALKSWRNTCAILGQSYSSLKSFSCFHNSNSHQYWFKDVRHSHTLFLSLVI